MRIEKIPIFNILFWIFDHQLLFCLYYDFNLRGIQKIKRFTGIFARFIVLNKANDDD